MGSKLKIDYKELFNSSSFGYICSQPDGKIIEVNNGFLEFTGYLREEVLDQKRIVDFLTKAGNIQYESIFAVMLKLKGNVKEFSFSFIKKDQSRIPVLINSIEVLNVKGECIYVQSTVFDISKRKNFENQLLVAKKEAEKLSKEIENLVYVATHDLKLPVSVIEGHFDYLRYKLPKGDKAIDESILFIDENIEQFNSTVKGLTDAIKIKNTTVAIEKLDLFQVINQSISDLQSNIKKLNGLLEISISEETFVRANYVFAKSVIHNILDNAVKYHSKERQLSIKISCETLEEFVCVTITDNGIGIDLKLHKNRIFGMFNRFNNTTEGTGMGLFIVKKMIEQMEGNIVIESELDIGTSFKIYFKRGI